MVGARVGAGVGLGSVMPPHATSSISAGSSNSGMELELHDHCSLASSHIKDRLVGSSMPFCMPRKYAI